MEAFKRIAIAVILAALLVLLIIPFLFSLVAFPHSGQVQLILQALVIAWAIIYIVQGL